MNFYLNVLVTILVSVNMAYASALAYKESITNYQTAKTSNGLLAFLWVPFVYFGGFLYKIIKLFSNVVGGKKDKEPVFNGMFSALLTFGFAYMLHLIFTVLSTVPDDINGFLAFLFNVKNSIVQVIYYAILFGMLGGDNSRLQDSIIGAIASKICDKLESLHTPDFIENINAVEAYARVEVQSVQMTKRGQSLHIVNWIKSVFIQTITTILEEVRGLTSLLVDIKNILSFVFTVVLVTFMTGIFHWVSMFNDGVNEDAEIAVSDMISSPAEIFTEQLMNFIVTMAIIVAIKLIIKLFMLVMPKSVRESYYSFNKKLYYMSMSKMNQYSAKSYFSDNYAKRHSFKTRNTQFDGTLLGAAKTLNDR